jgi:hypothetical protein
MQHEEVPAIADAVGRAAKALTEVSKIDTSSPYPPGESGSSGCGEEVTAGDSLVTKVRTDEEHNLMVGSRVLCRPREVPTGERNGSREP